MQSTKTSIKILLLLGVLSISACNKAIQKGQEAAKTTQKWQGQAPIRIVPTNTLPIQRQYLGTYNLGNGIYASNEFDGARLNGAVLSGDTLITVLITPENTPINPSPWYAFKLWSTEKRDIQLKMTYLNGAFHRYYPKISSDGKNWEKVQEKDLQLGQVDTSGVRPLPQNATIKLSLGPDTLWVAGQELMTSAMNSGWIDKLDEQPYISTESIGQSSQGRPIRLMKIGGSDDKKMIFVLSGQHPPEVTGYLAMRAFVEQIAGDSKAAQAFRKKFTTYVVPMANPDGIDNGHWRHNAGGIDLNRDWANVNQP
ncbi:MAG: M14 family zinc carboxypeptidase, partial [Bacteroidota bacterium]